MKSIRINSINIFIVVFFALSIITCTKKDNPVAPEENTNPGSKLLDTVINNVNSDVTVKVQSKLTITIPQGVVPAGTKLTVLSLNPTSLPADNIMEFTDAYDVSLSSGTSFNKELTITLNLDPSKLATGKLRYKIGSAYFNEASQKWVAFQGVVVDSTKNTITFKTNHLTKLSAWSIKRTVYGFTDFMESENYTVYWISGKIPSNSSYDSPNKTLYSSTDPHYVKDILKFLEEGRSVYLSQSLTLPSGKTNVYLTSMQFDGETGLLTGNISINQNVKYESSKGETQYKALKKACVHELMHAVQDYYYSTNFTYGAFRWWMEATATLTDRLVWPSESPYESEIYLSGSVFSMQKSWDDCGKDPDWYLAGGFLTYLCHYRAGAKVSLIELIKECSEIKNGLLIRGIINSILINKFNTTIEKEYHNYLLWYFNKDKYFKYETKSSSEEFTDYALLGSSAKTKEFLGKSIPYMAAKVIRAYNYNSPNEKMKIYYDAKSTTLHAYYFLNYTDDKGQVVTSFERKLTSKDSIEIFLPNIGSKWADILVVNESYSNSANYDALIKLVQPPTINSISPNEGKSGTEVTLSGLSFGSTKSNSKLFFGSTEIASTNLWTDTSIKFNVPSAASIGQQNVYVEVNGEKSNTVSFNVKTDENFSALQECKYIDIEIPFYATFEQKIDINGNVNTTVRADEAQRVDYDFQSTYGQNEIKLSGSTFSDSAKTTESDGTEKVMKIEGTLSSDFSSITNLKYSYEMKKTTNDTNFVETIITCEAANIPFSSKNTTSTAYYYGSYANTGKASINSYTYKYHSMESYSTEQNQKYVKEVNSTVTSFKTSDYNYISVSFRKTQ